MAKRKRHSVGKHAKFMNSKAVVAKENVFETIWSRRKFDILGKKRKGEERRIGLARSRAVQKRNKTLLKEYEQSGKSSVFVDKRIGEKDDALGEFDKAILRSQRERQLKLGKKRKYNLSDGEEDDFELQEVNSLAEMDDFEDEILPDDNDDAETAETARKELILKHINAQAVQSSLDRNSLEGEENKHKSKKEVMSELISKSKFFKAQKAKDKEENEQLMEELDKSFTSLVQSGMLLSLTQPGKINSLKSLVDKTILTEKFRQQDQLPVTLINVSSKQEKPDYYDKLVNEMSMDMRARPSDRTKTPEEIAQEERERLEQLEEKRKKRMLGTDDSSDEEDDGTTAYEDATGKTVRSISGDDLGDSFSLDEEPNAKKGWIDEILERNDANSESEGGESSDDDDDEGKGKGYVDHERTPLFLNDWEQSDDDNLTADEDEEEEGDGEEDDDGGEVRLESCKKAKQRDTGDIGERDTISLESEKAKENDPHLSTRHEVLPYIIDAPRTFKELSALLDTLSSAEILEAISRIRSSNAIRLAAENRKKMQVFYGLLLQYFAVLANKKPLNFKLLNLLLKPLVEMSKEIPYFAAICARQRILRIRMLFCEDVKNPGKSCWPPLKILFLLRLWSMIFPCSDFRHVVMTPAMLLMCEYLMRCPILTGRDVAVGSFLCSMVLSVARESKKFCPEAIIFLRTLLMSANVQRQLSCHDSQFYYLMELKARSPILQIHDHGTEITPLDFLTVMDTPDDSSFFKSDSFRASVLMCAIETLGGFISIYDGLSSFPEIFMPILDLSLELADQENMPYTLQEKLKDVSQLIKNKVQEHHMLRRPLQLRKQKPVPIKLLNPKFEENFVKGRDYDPDRELAERRKLKKLLKREAKGAARELRKDNYFLFEVKEKEKAREEEERAERYGKAKAFLQEQEHAAKSGQLGKRRKGRR